jgi:hypothetical protein
MVKERREMREWGGWYLEVVLGLVVFEFDVKAIFDTDFHFNREIFQGD